MEGMLVGGAIGAIKVVSMVYDVVTYPLFLLLQRPWEKIDMSNRPKAETVAQDAKNITYRSLTAPKRVHNQLLRENIRTMDQLLNFITKKYGSKSCLGTRQILAEEDEVQKDGRVFKKYVMGDYHWKSYAEVDTLARNFGNGLRALGQEPMTNIVIFAETRAEWLIAAHGCFKQNIPLVTLYSTLGDEAIAHGINETEVTTLITSHDLLPKFKNILHMTPNIKTIIFLEDQLKPTPRTGYRDDVTLVSFTELIGLGAQTNVEAKGPTPDDVAIIMYTSGSTGAPKGVILTHKNMMATLRGFSDYVDIDERDLFLGFLPLAHVFELLSESECMLCGVPIGYSTPLTMIDSSSKIKHGTKGDASVLKPTCMTSVPLILDRINKGIQDKVTKGSPLKKALFDFAFQYKLKWARKGFDTPIVNRLIFSAPRALLGGRVRFILSGGAPLSPDTHELIKNVLCLKVIQGYGLTETTACATGMDEYDMSTDRVGSPSTVTLIRLVDWEEGNYRVSDQPYPRGEILIGGDNISPGYYKLPDKTADEFFQEGNIRWFKTGDIGECHRDGAFRIIDRKKDLVKLQLGEYVSLGKVEAQLKTCPVVENICVYGDPTKHYTVALVVPNPSKLNLLATDLGVETRNFEELCKDPSVEKAVLKELEVHARKCKLEKFEVPAAVKLVSEVWSPDMGLVTAAFKLKRKDIQERYQHEINRMYAS